MKKSVTRTRSHASRMMSVPQHDKGDYYAGAGTAERHVNAAVRQVLTARAWRDPKRLAGAGSLMVSALLATAPALAQNTAETQSGLGEITVSASRITTSGFNAPTPTTTVGMGEIQALAEPNLYNAIAEIPSMMGDQSTSIDTDAISSGGGGVSYFNIHGVGSNRTLTLLDGERVVSPLTTDVVDVSQIPQALVQRVDVVTGGASASWGSDAVAGVVNFVLNHNFNGIEANVEGAETAYGDDRTGLISLTAGTPFADGKGHIEASGEAYHDAGVPDGIGSRDWNQGTRLFGGSIQATPPGQPQEIVANHGVLSTVAAGGIITGGPLKGTAFGADGSPYAYQYGQFPANGGGGYMIGGGSNQASDISLNGALDEALTRDNLYVRVDYDLTSSLRIYADAIYGYEGTFDVSDRNQYYAGSITVQCDNAYLPASITAACAANHITSFPFGTTNQDISTATGGLDIENSSTLHRYTLGLDGNFSAFGSDWTWNAYGEFGLNNRVDQSPNTIITPYYMAAINAVAGPNGEIVCASAVAQAQGCRPLDVFGTGVASADAIHYVLGDPMIATNDNERAIGTSLNSTPFSTWAGKASIALGYDYRNEEFDQTADCISYSNCATAANPAGNPLLSTTTANYFAGNFHPSSGSYHVSEGFLETDIPLLKDRGGDEADVDLAGRETDYSTSGSVFTWKYGVNFSPAILHGVRFRALESHDIRAPDLSELFSAPSGGVSVITDLFPPYAGQSFTVHELTVGNQKLQPESSMTKSIGVVLQPDWLPGFNTSIDYYHLYITNVIGTVSNPLGLCYNGNTAACADITRNSSGVITEIVETELNIGWIRTAGYDIESSYQIDLNRWFPNSGRLILHGLATHVGDFTSNTGLVGAIPTQTAGENSGSIPSWHWTLIETYAAPNFEFNVIERRVSPGVINTAYIACTVNCPVSTVNNPTINENHLPGAFYIDIGGSYNVTKAGQLYFKIDNIADIPPAIVPGSQVYSTSINPSLYDVLGRTYHLGFRLKL